MSVLNFKLELVGCKSCVSKITNKLNSINEIENFEIDFENKTLLVDSTLTHVEIESIIALLGYKAIFVVAEKNDDALQDDSSLQTKGAAQIKNPSKNVNTLSDNIVIFKVDNATCASCVSTIEKAMKSLTSVTCAQMNLAEKELMVTFKTSKTTSQNQSVIDVLSKNGYNAILLESDSDEFENEENLSFFKRHAMLLKSILPLIFGLALMLNSWMTGSMSVIKGENQLYWFLIAGLTLLFMIFSGRHFYISAYKNLKLFNSNMDTLIALGTGTAFIYSLFVTVFPQFFVVQHSVVYFEAVLMIIALVNLGQLIEDNAKQKSNVAIQSLMKLQPKMAVIIKDGKSTNIPIKDVRTNDMLQLMVGQAIAVDGVIHEGEISVNESMLTGEPNPIIKKKGDKVFAGCLIENGEATMLTSHVGAKTALQQIILLVKQAQSSKPDIAKLADKISSVFVPVVLVIASLAFIVWAIFGPDISYAISVFTAVIIIACPCALGLATPMSIIVGVGKAAQIGVIVKNAQTLQDFNNVDVIVMDKTGTITQGHPSVVMFECFLDQPDNNLTANKTLANKIEVLEILASIESKSSHPLAKAIINYSLGFNIKNKSITEFNSISGQGIQAKIDNDTYFLGKPEFILNQVKNVDSAINEKINLALETGSTIVVLASQKEILSIIGIDDPVRESSKSAIDAIKNLDKTVWMLSGDHLVSAKKVADTVGIDHVKAQVLPKDKLAFIQLLQSEGKKVAMVGDGINDAPALAAANIGIAMGGGTDVAIQSADITLMQADLSKIVDIIEISKQTFINIKQNLFFAFAYNCLGIPIAAGVLYPFTGWLLSPVIGATAMALSSITVVLNANRLKIK